MKKLIVIFVMLITANAFAQWVPVNITPGDTIVSLANSNSILFVSSTANAYRSADYGLNWTGIGSGIFHRPIYTLETNGSDLYAGSNNIHKSTNYGTNWNVINNQFANFFVYSIVFSNPAIYLGISGGVLRSTNDGTNWALVNSGMFGQDIHCMGISGTTLFSGTNNGIYRSTNNGTLWTQIAFSGDTINSFAVSGSNIFVGSSNNGVQLSTNNGNNWSTFNTGLTSLDIHSLLISGSNLIAGASNGIFVTSTNTNNWTNKNQGFATAPVANRLTICGSYLFCGTIGQSVWRRNLSEIVGIKQISESVPSSFSLKQNFPNPFNPSTNIKFDVPLWRGVGGRTVQLKIYDISGREISTLVNENLPAGTYEVMFDASHLNSGVYFYKIISGNYSETKKMLFLK
jgi:photosystem II stability/assembly factor-like uncharacterized protein